jgi:hypothetical protein
MKNALPRGMTACTLAAAATAAQNGPEWTWYDQDPAKRICFAL